ncbi:MAG: glutamyl-tRNA reductase, partial [Deltaproteobacteria bacterium]|nr:glutamyl-tRNA reductase [Deltaproteobacteria bacterium]
MGTGFKELMVLSTCNRVEYYFVDGQPEAGFVRLLEWLNRRFLVEPGALEPSSVKLEDQVALIHLFRVACALESMVIGEPQILGQLKDAYRLAGESTTLGPELNGLMPRVFHAAKRVRSETGISRFAVSISYVAAELAARIFESLENRTVLVIGAGEMAELAVTHLRKKGVSRLIITNRTFANGVALAEKFGGEAVRFEDLSEYLSQADIVLSSTGARGYVIDQDRVRAALKARRGNPMFFIDIAVPRDIDPKVNDLADAYLYDIDDLQSAADANRKEREKEAQAAQLIIEDELSRYFQWRSANQVSPLVTALRTHFLDTGAIEMEKGLSRLRHLPQEDTEQVRRLVHNLLNKLLHVPSTRLKALGEDPNAPLYAEALRHMFDLSTHPPASGPTEAPGKNPAQPKIVPFPAGTKPSGGG